MPWTIYEYVLAIIMVAAGSVNILISKWTDKTYSIGRDGKLKPFIHPFIQALGMFFAEMIWLFVYKFITRYYISRNIPEYDYHITVRGGNDFNPMVFGIPAMLDLVGTSLLFIGLTLTSASSFQMFRGATIIFTGLLSAGFLGSKLKWQQWLGISVITLGLFIVGVGDYNLDTHIDVNVKKVITGDLIIIIAQVFIAVQNVVEQHFIVNVSSFQALGWEGFFGFLTLSVLLIPMNYISVGNIIFNNPEGRLEDVVDAFYQLRNSQKIVLGFVGGIISLAFFNISAISVTKQLSATTRTVLDSVRTLIIWILSMLFSWLPFTSWHIVGFVVLVVGMCLYEDVFFSYVFNAIRAAIQTVDQERQLIINGQPANPPDDGESKDTDESPSTSRSLNNFSGASSEFEASGGNALVTKLKSHHIIQK